MSKWFEKCNESLHPVAGHTAGHGSSSGSGWFLTLDICSGHCYTHEELLGCKHCAHACSFWKPQATGQGFLHRSDEQVNLAKGNRSPQLHTELPLVTAFQPRKAILENSFCFSYLKSSFDYILYMKSTFPSEMVMTPYKKMYGGPRV